MGVLAVNFIKSPGIGKIFNATRILPSVMVQSRTIFRADKLREIERMREGTGRSQKKLSLVEFFEEVAETARVELTDRFDIFDDRKFRELNEEYRRLGRGELEMRDKDDFAVFRILWKFGDPNAFSKWFTTCDYDNYGGYSTCTFEQTPDNTAVFSGYLNTEVPKDGITAFAGYCNIATKRLFRDSRYLTPFWDRRRTYDWKGYTHIVVRCRGDGRTYLLNLHRQGAFDMDRLDLYNYPLYTRGGPYWQVTKIPFSKFIFTNRGCIQDVQDMMLNTHCTQVSITIADRNVGNFSLEIDYIGVIYDPLHENIFDYEMYETHLAGLA